MGDRVMAASSGLLLLLTAAIAAVRAAQEGAYGPSPDDDIMKGLKRSVIFKPDSGENWTDTYPCNWISSVDCNKDHSGTLRVTMIRFWGMLDGGTLPANLESLTELEEFDGSSNNLAGEIPNFADSVSYLGLGDNQFTSISPGLFHSKPNLSEVELSHNARLAPWEIPPALNNIVTYVQFLNMCYSDITL
ncbi:unnamed protein product [Cuscuta epithymum]|uniref:Leucine-rich repeat-containing N-terminal plant-type domain-containing protein n=1 Tax=Cuscuta epithymum TaxID=186058 RepID=A0AAV0FG64_9ASTE|nr:unnamed protein product [Cuscuta epithymum]